MPHTVIGMVIIKPSVFKMTQVLKPLYLLVVILMKEVLLPNLAGRLRTKHGVLHQLDQVLLSLLGLMIWVMY